MWKKAISFILIIIITLTNSETLVNAQTDIRFKNITIEDGLSQATVETIYQDSKGYIWIGTNDGLNRYNGYDFKVYRKEINSEISLTNNYIIKVTEDEYNNLWVATLNGVNKFNKDRTKVTQYIDLPDKGNLACSKLSDLLITKDGKILVATYKGVDIYDPQEDKFYPFIKDLTTIKNENIYALEEDEQGNIWIGSQEGLDVIDSNGNIKESFIYDKVYDDKLNNSVKEIYSDKDGIIWVGTYNAGAVKIDTVIEECKSYTESTNVKTSIPSNYIKNFFRDKDSNLWVCTSNGLSIYNSKEDTFKTFTNNLYEKNSLLNDNTYVAYQDLSGLIWIGTYAGVSIFDPNNTIATYKRNPIDNFTLSENSVKGLYEDSKGYIWVGTNSKGIDILDRKNNKVIHKISTETAKTFTNDSINVITGDDNNVYVGTNNGLNVINLSEKTNTPIDIQDGLVNKFIKNLYLDEDGYLWIGTSAGYNIYNVNTKEITNVTEMFEMAGIKDLYSSAIFKDKDGVYWFGTFYGAGLIKLDPKDNVIKTYLHQDGNEKTISSDTIRSIAEDGKGNLWIGTPMGLNKFNKKTEEFKSYTIKDGLPNNTIYGVLVDEDNNPWMSTNSGISKFDVKLGKFVNLDVTDGLQSNEFNGGSYYKTRNNEFLFGGIEGLNIINPSKVNKSSSPSIICFDEFKVNGKYVAKLDGESYTKTDNTISVKVFMPEYKNTRNNQFFYSIDSGKGGNWIEMESNEVTLSNLSPGKYTLKVKGRNANGVFSNEEKVSFIIRVPFWRSKSALFIYAGLVVILIYYEKYKVKRLDDIVKLRTKELSKEINVNKELFDRVLVLEKNKNSYFINLSHELRTPLNVLSSLQQVIKQLNKEVEPIDKTKLDHYMDVASKNIKRLLNIINDIIDTSKIDNGNYNLNLEDNNIVSIVEEAALSLKDYIEEHGVELIIDPEVEEKIIKCDAVEIERCIVNLVGNANKFTSEGDFIKVVLKDLGDNVQIEVQDNGEGIPKEYQKSIFNRFNQGSDSNNESKNGSGLGLTITKNIIELHGGTITVESQVGKGSNFIITLPAVT